MATLALRPEGCGGRLRFELVDVVEERRDSWFCMPALIVAAAARDTEEALGDKELGVR